MINEDLDVEIRVKELLHTELKIEINKMIEKIEAAKVEAKDEWTDGLNTGLGWAVRILKKDKSAY